jgi:CO dehydrogenase maturation factor
MIEDKRQNFLPLSGKRIGIVGKGGAGKSTVTIFLARALRQRGYDICILDADSTNIGMHRALGMKTAPESLIDYFGGMVFSGGSVTCPVDDPTPLPNPELNLDELPSKFQSENVEGIHLLTAGKIGDLGPGAGCDGPINKIARDVRVTSSNKEPVMLVDFKAGFEDSARGAITGLDWVIMVVDPTHASINMARHMRQMVAKMQAGAPPATKHLEDPQLVSLMEAIFREASVQDVFAVLNRIPDAETEAYLREILQESDVRTIGCLPEDLDLMQKWLRGNMVKSSILSKASQEILTELEHAEIETSKSSQPEQI